MCCGYLEEKLKPPIEVQKMKNETMGLPSLAQGSWSTFDLIST